MPINIGYINTRVQNEAGVMNIYCTKIKLRAAAHQAIYLVIFQ